MRNLLDSFLSGLSEGNLSGFVKKYIVNPFLSMTVVDVLDILVLFAVIYWGYRFIRERRAGRLAIGLLLVVGVALLSAVLEMRAVSALLLNMYQVGLLAIVVIFQPELRDALEKMGNTPSNFHKLGNNNPAGVGVASLISVLSEAVCAMSAEKTGALIVIERGTRLGEFITTGEELDAVPSTALIRNLFYDKSPLHDGAVVIRDGRICAAGCILPSAQNESVFINMGTRHRAAVGISEISDAVVLVVSEETGTISIANNGIIKRDYDSGSLKEDLFLLLAGAPGEEEEAEANESLKGADHE